MGFIWGQKVMGRVRKGRKSSNLFFDILGNRVMLNSVQNHSSIPQLSIITELSMPTTFFISVLSWRQTTQKTSKNERGRRAVTACYLLETDVSLFFLPKSYTFNYLRRNNFEVRSFKNLWMLWISLPSIFIWSYLIHTWKVSRKISLGSVIHSFVGQLFQSWLAAGVHMPKICDFFRCFKKPWLSKMDGPCRRLTTFWG